MKADVKKRVIKMRFDNYHPVINLIYFTAAACFAVVLSHPVFLMLSYVCAFLYSVRLKGKKAFVFGLALIPFMVLYTWIYSMYHHFGVTVLFQNFAGNDMTAEALIYGLVISIKAASFIMIMSCVFEVFSSDKVVYLLGRISPQTSLFVSVLMRSVPRIKEAAGRINRAQRGIGRGCLQKNAAVKGTGIIRFLSILITWILDSFNEASVSMKNRGYSLKGRTAFSMYRFDNRDRTLVIYMALSITAALMAVFAGETFAQYDPEMIFAKSTGISYVFYSAYALFLLMPAILQTITQCRFKRLRAARP